MAPKRAQRGPRWPQVGPKGAQDGPQRAQDGPKSAPKGPKRGPKAVQNRSSKAFRNRSRKRETPPQSQTRIWADFGALLGPIWGLCWAPGALLRRLKTMKMRNIECSKYLVKYRSDWPSGGPREGQVGVMLGSSWPQKGILRQLNIILPTKVNFREGEGNLPGVRRAPGGPWGGDLGEGS